MSTLCSDYISCSLGVTAFANAFQILLDLINVIFSCLTDWPFPLWARNASAAVRAGRAHRCHSKSSTILLLSVFVPCSFTSSSSSYGPLQFNELCKMPCHFLRSPRWEYRLLVNSVWLNGCLLSLQWQTATFNWDWWKMYIITKLLTSFCRPQDVTDTWPPKVVAELLLTGSKEWEEFAPELPHILTFLTLIQPEFNKLIHFPRMEKKEMISPLISMSCFPHQQKKDNKTHLYTSEGCCEG